MTEEPFCGSTKVISLFPKVRMLLQMQRVVQVAYPSVKRISKIRKWTPIRTKWRLEKTGKSKGSGGIIKALPIWHGLLIAYISPLVAQTREYALWTSMRALPCKYSIRKQTASLLTHSGNSWRASPAKKKVSKFGEFRILEISPKIGRLRHILNRQWECLSIEDSRGHQMALLFLRLEAEFPVSM